MGALDCVSNERIKSTESTEVFTINMSSSNQCLDEPKRDVESQFSKSNSNLGRHSVWWTLAIDLPLLLIVALLLGLFELRVLPGHKGGFFCNDPNLNYTFTGDTVSMGAIMSTVILLPILLILVTEVIFLEADYLQRPRIFHAVRNTIWLYRSYAYGLFLNLAVVEIMKLITGAPRPTFFDICKPDTGLTCRGSEFVTSFECTPSPQFSAWFQSDSYHSFPSGHTSLSVHCGLFLACYLQKRAFDWSHRCIFVVPVMQLVLLTYSALCSLSRVTDHRHHWWDVLVGSFIGIASMWYSVIVLCRNFSYASSKTADVAESQQSNFLYPRHEVIS